MLFPHHVVSLSFYVLTPFSCPVLWVHYMQQPGRKRAAETAFLIAQKDGNVNASYELGNLLRQQGRTDKAVEVFKVALDADGPTTLLERQLWQMDAAEDAELAARTLRAAHGAESIYILLKDELGREAEAHYYERLSRDLRSMLKL